MTKKKVKAWAVILDGKLATIHKLKRSFYLIMNCEDLFDRGELRGDVFPCEIIFDDKGAKNAT